MDVWGGRGPFPARGRHYQHYLLLVPLHYGSERWRGFVTVLQHGNDVLGYLGWCQLPTPTGQEKLELCYKTSPHISIHRACLPCSKMAAVISFKQESGKNLCVVMIWTLLSPSRQEILFLKGRICLHRMLFRREAKARRVTQMFLNHQTDRNREKQLRAVLRVLKLLKAWTVWNSKYIELRPRGHIPSCRPLITEKGLPAVLS